MKLSKNTVIDLWNSLADIPTVMEKDMTTVINEDFLGWPAGTDVETIWHFFDDQFAEFGGVYALMYENPKPERKFQIHTPAGIIEVYAKHEGDSPEDYPGVFVDLRRTDSQLSGEEIGDIAACVEYDSGSHMLQTVVYQMLQEEPTHIEIYEPPMTFGEFLNEYQEKIVTLDVWDRKGREIPEGFRVPDEVDVMTWYSGCGSYNVTVDMLLPPPERIPIEDIRRGLQEGDIILGTVENMVAAEIGDRWFHLSGENCKGVTAAEHVERTAFEDDVRTIWEDINSEPINGFTEAEAEQCLYYKAKLQERFRERDAANCKK